MHRETPCNELLGTVSEKQSGLSHSRPLKKHSRKKRALGGNPLTNKIVQSGRKPAMSQI